MLRFLLADYIDILMISESKLEGTFHRRNSKFVVLRPLVDWIETIEEEEYYCL